ncbi:non-canonical purine NTP pyrophosphatase [Bacillus cereus]|uniref:dITP/XTP pyrophosphatase n=1 Tax=Bacillus cereus TaxID=1396 RepID=A0A9X6SWP5_BACCE|nr:non-canonical purine NTP pyrophosphatase [Bacillus cereus]PEU53690.1 non-canonical purine NTP pyrophosphatase [Bacillus cereus]PFJ30478.1 non-canonical purine NTP pyrophosphatase [Bacillus cereus]PFO20166.1 non-canonical purine NTP pyrophosphatase [Bacillus cereus]PGN79226.1 non-canonical purine NTP pyrophosphatase [Bacillus cereus]
MKKMKQVVVATKNMGKVREFAELFERFDLEVKSLHDFPHIEEVEETGETFEENAILKADSLSRQLNAIVIADDSGLIVDALNGKPGVYSARFAGEPKDDQANIDKVLQELNEVAFEKRKARFYCALAVAFPEGDKKPVIVNGTCEGFILEQRRGENGFGYDPIFYVEEYKKAMAELSSDEKNAISHRGRALRKLEEKIPEWFLGE